jgi:hypothetical protein
LTDTARVPDPANQGVFFELMDGSMGTFQIKPAGAAPEVDGNSAAIPLAIVAGGLALAFGRRRSKV